MTTTPTKKEANTLYRCPECGSTNVFRDERRGELICGTCGLIIDDKIIDKGPEWRAFSSEENNNRARTGSPLSLTIHDKGLSTTIDWKNQDANGKEISVRKRAELYRLRKWQIRTIIYSSQSRNLSIAMSELERLSSQLGIPREAKETAALIYRKTLSKRLVRGRSIEGIVAASLYLACRIHKIPRSLDEIVIQARTNRKELGQSVRLILKEIDIHPPVPSAMDYIPKIGNSLGLSGKTIYTAIDIIKEAKKKGITAGKDPGGLAAASIYIAGIIQYERRTQREIAEAAHVTEVTVRNRYKDLASKLNITIKP